MRLIRDLRALSRVVISSRAGYDALLLELASQPGGFDRNLAENIGIRTIYAPGLPGKCAPYGAAELMREAIYDVLNEQGE